MEWHLSTTWVRHLRGMPLLSKKIFLFSFIVALDITLLLAVFILLIIRITMSWLHRKSHKLWSQSHSVLVECVLECISWRFWIVSFTIFLLLENFYQALIQLFVRCLLIQVLVSGSVIVKCLRHRYHRQVQLVRHVLEAFPPVGVGELIVIKDLDAPFHPGVDKTLVGKLACICKAHRECGAASILLVWLFIR